MVRQFHAKYDCTSNSFPTVLPEAERKFREMLISEETNELYEAMFDEDLVRIADGLGDTIYVLLGTAVAYGIELDVVFAEIQRSNMTKDHAGAHNAKPIKGIRFSPPQLARLLESMSL